MKLITRQSPVVMGIALTAILFALCICTEAQQPKKIARIGYVFASTPAATTLNIEAFRQGMRELGHVEGRLSSWNFVTARAGLNGSADSAGVGRPQVGHDRGRHRCGDCSGQTGDLDDPDRHGVKQRSGRDRICGEPRAPRRKCDRAQPYLSGTQWKAAGAAERSRPAGLSRVAALGYTANPAYKLQLKEVESAAQALKLQLEIVEVREPKDFDEAFGAAKKGRAEAVNILISAFLAAHRKKLVENAEKIRVPMIYDTTTFVEAGGLMSYGRNLAENFPARCILRRQDSEGSEPGRTSGLATN